MSAASAADIRNWKAPSKARAMIGFLESPCDDAASAFHLLVEIMRATKHFACR